MKPKPLLFSAILCATLAAAGWPAHASTNILADLAAMDVRNPPAQYDGAARIAAALKLAKADGKRVLVQSSAQGCGWCHIMHTLMTTNAEIQAKIKSDFIYVLVDTTNDGQREFYKKYAQGTDHTLVLAELDADGKELACSIAWDIVQPDPSAPPGNYHITPEHVMELLNQWSAKKP
jgi:hypothetical protein